MKLWQKLSLVTVAILLIASGILGVTVIYKSTMYNQEKTLENYEQQLKSTAYALSRELQNSSIENYREATKYSYLHFLIQRYDASEYILIENDRVICNDTAYELNDPSDEKWSGDEVFSVIQKRETEYIMVAGKKLPVLGDTEYKLVLIKDISDLYRDIRIQAFYDLLICLGMAAVSVLLVFLITGRILRPLKELQKTAIDISAGNWKRRARVYSEDEIGIVAKAFNSMAEKIEDQVTELAAESERRRQMLGSLAHEMKTPMTSIIGYSDSLLHVNLKQEQKERALNHIYEESKRLERLSGKLMSLIGMYDNESISMKEADMKRLFEQVALLETYHLKEKGITLVCICDMENRALDEDLFTSLLVNLIDNAAKASEAGSTITLEGKGNVVSVKDEGCGIPEDELARVTEAFYMVDKARSRKAGGTGLGLALCSKIAELHGAGLKIESKLHEGTTVSVVFEGK